MIPNTGSLAGKVIFITGASRGIGKAIALKCAKDGAKIVIAAKTTEPHAKLPGTIYTAAEEIEKAGGEAFPCVVDVRSETDVESAMNAAVARFGSLDALINNASAISLTGSVQTDMKRYDLMHHINTRGTFLASKLAVPLMMKSKNTTAPHILNISPPLNMRPRWFRDNLAYTMAKYGMSMCVAGMSEEFQGKIAVNALWPETAIRTAAMDMLGDGKMSDFCRTPEIMADAAYLILTRPVTFSGNFCIDSEVLKAEGVTDMEQYAVKKGHPLMPDFFLDEFDKFQESMKGSDVGISGGESKEAPAAGGGGAVGKVFSGIKGIISADYVEKVGAVYAFDLKGKEPGEWFLDLKNGDGACGAGKGTAEPDVTLSMDSGDFLKMFSGKLKPTTAFMMGKLKIKGDTQKALKLEKLMASVRKAKL